MKKLTYEEYRKVMDKMEERSIAEYHGEITFDEFLKEFEDYKIICPNSGIQAIESFETDSEAKMVPYVRNCDWLDGLQNWRYDIGWFMIKV